MTEIVQVLERLRFDKETGQFFWVNPNKHHLDLIGKVAGCVGRSNPNKKYWVIKLNGKTYKRARLVYLVTHGKWPEPCVDHINGNSLDDRPENLRQATVTENSWNHKFRKRKINLPMGVRVNPAGTYSARISVNKKQIHLGFFKTTEEAYSVYQMARKEMYGQFA